jgi:hypothetical protein
MKNYDWDERWLLFLIVLFAALIAGLIFTACDHDVVQVKVPTVIETEVVRVTDTVTVVDTVWSFHVDTAYVIRIDTVHVHTSWVDTVFVRTTDTVHVNDTIRCILDGDLWICS